MSQTKNATQELQYPTFHKQEASSPWQSSFSTKHGCTVALMGLSPVCPQAETPWALRTYAKLLGLCMHVGQLYLAAIVTSE